MRHWCPAIHIHGWGFWNETTDWLSNAQTGNTLDLIITELAAEVQIKNVYCGPYIYDHCIITCTCNIPKTKMVTKQIKYRDFKKVNMTEMIEDMDLDSINLASENLEEIDVRV